jgi:hypothetical protein
VDLSALALQIGQTYVPAAEDAGKQLSLAIAPGVSVDGDRELLAQLLVNLIENALRHTQDAAGILVELAAGRGAPVLAVSDNGPGIPGEERDRVIGRFYRLERSRATEGSGLGLSLVAAVADLHRAELVFTDRAPGLSVSIAFSERAGTARPLTEMRAGALHRVPMLASLASLLGSGRPTAPAGGKPGI